MDLNSINANINRLLTNIWAVISFLKEFAVDGAKDVSITYINADGSESIKTFPNIAKMNIREHYDIFFNTASFASVDTWTPVDSLINQDNPIFKVVDGYKIIFKQKGTYEIKVQVFTRYSDIENNHTRLGFAGGKYTIVGTTLEQYWRCTKLNKVRHFNIGQEEHLVYLNGRFGTWADSGVSYIQITRLGD
jgi:hypothetical protein